MSGSSGQWPLLAAYRSWLGGPAATVSLEVSAADDMLRFAREGYGGDHDRALVSYLHTGRQNAALIGDLLGSHSAEARILDFASGYGRLTRHLVQTVDAGRITVSDVLADAVRFQQVHFGVNGVVSETEPDRFELRDEFDLVFVASLFTHLPRARFAAWLARLWKQVSPNGMLVFSVHDTALLGSDAPYAFLPGSESGILSPDEYGATWVSETFVREELAVAAPAARVVRLPRALNNFQDVYVVTRSDRAVASALPPDGHLDSVASDGRVWTLKGWARVQDERALRVELWLRGERRAVTDEFSARPDVSPVPAGWRLVSEFPLDLSGAEPVFVVAIGAGERMSLLFHGSVDALQLTPHGGAKRDSGPMEAEAARHRDTIFRQQQRLLELEAEIAAMRASRFWKLRDAWFRLKRAAGLREG